MPPSLPRLLPNAFLGLLLIALTLSAPLIAQTADPAADGLLAEARRLVAAGDADGALRELGLLVERFAQDRHAPTAWLEIARLRRDRGEKTAAIAAIERLAADFPRAPANAEAQVLRLSLIHI